MINITGKTSKWVFMCVNWISTWLREWEFLFFNNNKISIYMKPEDSKSNCPSPTQVQNTGCSGTWSISCPEPWMAQTYHCSMDEFIINRRAVKRASCDPGKGSVHSNQSKGWSVWLCLCTCTVVLQRFMPPWSCLFISVWITYTAWVNEKAAGARLELCGNASGRA